MQIYIVYTEPLFKDEATSLQHYNYLIQQATDRLLNKIISPIFKFDVLFLIIIDFFNLPFVSYHFSNSPPKNIVHNFWKTFSGFVVWLTKKEADRMAGQFSIYFFLHSFLLIFLNLLTMNYCVVGLHEVVSVFVLNNYSFFSLIFINLLTMNYCDVGLDGVTRVSRDKKYPLLTI